MSTNECDCMHFYFAKYDNEISIELVDLLAEYIQKLAGNISANTTFDDVSENITSTVVVTQYPTAKSYCHKINLYLIFL